MTPKISIICPLYNSLPFIKAMIDSLKAQTMSDFEVIIIDDHSTDGSINAAKDYTKDDKRFRFLQTTCNSGPGVARNIGIDVAKGHYLAFIDSDNEYHPDFLRLLFDATAGGKDLAYCQLQYKGGKKAGRTHRNPVVESGVFTVESKRRFLKHFVTFSVCFLYRKDFLLNNHLRFPELSNSEDTNFLIKNILLARSIECIDKPLYYYVLHPGSLTTSHRRKKYRDRLKSLNLLMKEFSTMKHNREYDDLQLSNYNGVMRYLWLKKGLLLSIIELMVNG